MTLARPVRLAALGCATAGPRTASDRTDDYEGYGANPRPPGDAREPSPAPPRFAASLLGGGGESFDDPVALSVGGACVYGDSGPAWYLEAALVFGP